MIDQLIDLMKYFDIAVQKTTNEKGKQKILLEMFRIECKYNLDILDVINFNKKTFNKSDISEIINLLSCEALERILIHEKTSTSFITDSFKKLFRKKTYKNKGIQDFLKENDKLLNLYKRIIVLKSLTKISQSNSVIKNIKYKIRLKNLNDILLIAINV